MLADARNDGDHLRLFAVITGSIVDSCHHCREHMTKPPRHDRAAKSSHDFILGPLCMFRRLLHGK